MTLPSRPPRVHRGSALPPGVPPLWCTLDNKTPKRGELHLRVEGLEWQNMAFEARPPACCSLLISWWGQASYNSPLMPLSVSLAFSPATAVFSVHSSMKRFESYLQDMGFLELTLVNGNTTFDLKDVSRTMLGKLSVSVSSLTEGHPIRGSYPIFASGHRLIGSLTLGITVTFYNRAAEEAVGQCRVELNRCRRAPPRPEIAKSLMVSSFERIEELASKKTTLPLYPLPPVVGPGRQSMRRDVNVNSYSSSNSERSSGSPLPNEDVKLVERSLKGLKSSPFDQTVQKIVNKRLPRTKSSLSSESEVTLSTVSDVNSSPLQRDTETNDAHFRPANPYLDPSYCELDGLEAEKADSLCGSDESSLSCVISKSARLMKSLACEPARHTSDKSVNLSCNETTQDSNRLQDLDRKGCHSPINSTLEKDLDLSKRTRKDILKVDRLDKYASGHESYARENTDVHESYGKQSSDSSTSERIRNLRAISALNTWEGFEERNPQSSLRSPHLCTDEAQRGGLSDLLLPPTSGVRRSTCYTNNLFENPANPTGQNVWRRDEEQVADEVMPKGVSFTDRNTSDPARPVSLGPQPPLIPKVDFGFDPGGNRNSSIPSRFSLAQTKATNLTAQLNGHRTDPIDSCYLEGKSCLSVPQSGQPNARVGIEPGNRNLRSPCSSPQTVIDDIEQLIKRAEACRDTLKKPEFPKTRLMASSPMASAESIHLSRSHSGHSLGLNSSSDDLLDNILAANHKGLDGELPTKVHRYSEDLDLAEDIDDATDVMTAALLEALYVDNDKTANFSSAVKPDSFKARHQDAETGGVEGYWHDDYLQSRYNGLKNPKCWPEVDRLNGPERLVTLSFDDRIPGQEVSFLGPKHDQPFNLRVTIGKLVLCGPMVRDLADCRPSKGLLMHPTCTCSLTVSFPALIPPYSSKQRICVSPISFGTRDAVFDHQSQLSWNTLPGHDLQDWQSRDLRVAVLLTWQRFDTMECAGYVSLEKVVTSMPGVYRTSLPLVLTSHLAHKRCRSRSPSKGLSPKTSGKQTTKSGLKHPAGASNRNCSENSERLASVQKDAVARVDVMLQLFHGSPVPATKHEPFEETLHTQTKRPWRINEIKPLAPRMLTNSAPVLGNSQMRIIENLPGLTTILKASFAKDEIRTLAFLQDRWLQVIVHDVINCFENVLSSPQYSSNMKVRMPHLLLVVKSGSEQIVQVPFPQKLSLRNEIPGNITGGVLPAPEQLLISSKAVMFIEVWHDAGVVNRADSTRKPPGLLVGLIKAPLTLSTSIVSSADCHRVSPKRPEVVAEGLYQVFDPLQCTAVGTVMVMVTLGSSQQMHRLWKENKAAILIQRRVREFLTSGLGPDKSIEITRFWDTNKNSRAK